jgi:hypothetical protein
VQCKRRWQILGVAAWLISRMARAGDAPAVPEPAPVADPAPVAEPDPGEVIEVTGKPPVAAGVISVDGDTARKTAGALGEPFRALALLPGVTTSIAAAGYPIIRGTLPGESRFEFDGIELPMLYHLLLGNQVIHPALIGDLELRAGGYGAEHGQMLGGLIEVTPAPDRERTELHVDLVEAGGFRSQRLSDATWLAVAARAGTLTGIARLVAPGDALDYVDQQARLVHRLGNGDELALTSLGAYDYVKLTDTYQVRSFELGFHRLDARWSRRRPGGQLRAGVQTELDTLGTTTTSLPVPDPSIPPGSPPQPPSPPERERGRSYGGRVYADGGLVIAPWLTVRAGGAAHRRRMAYRGSASVVTHNDDPFLGLARAVDTEDAWAAFDLRAGPFTITPGVRADRYHADLPAVPARNSDVDPRLAITAALGGGGLAELSGGRYSAPPQVSVIQGPIAIGPVPVTEGAALAAGLSHGVQAQASLRTPLGEGWQASTAAYYRDTDYAVDFGMLGKAFTSHQPCANDGAIAEARVYRHVDVRAIGLEAMVRRELGRSVTGWLSYSLGKIDRDLGFVQLPHDYDQRHTLSASVQWRHGAWLLGSSAQLHTGRPAVYPQITTCSAGQAFTSVDITSDPTDLRRLPTSWRLDLRAEREYRFSGWSMHVYAEMQNASLTREALGWDLTTDPIGSQNYRVVPTTLFLPLPIVGMEVTL